MGLKIFWFDFERFRCGRCIEVVSMVEWRLFYYVGRLCVVVDVVYRVVNVILGCRGLSCIGCFS